MVRPSSELQKQTQQQTYLLDGVGLLLALLSLIVYGYAHKQKANLVLQRQKEEIKTQRTKAKNAQSELQAIQTQLIQKEKMASLGELTAGIAHEIQNPLNFVNNFSEVSAELVTELEEEKLKPDRDTDLEAELLVDLKQNLQKINHHVGRASAIVRGRLEHSRSSTGEKRPTDLNDLADEYLKLAYHGSKAKDKTGSPDRFNSELVTDFGRDLGLIEVDRASVVEPPFTTKPSGEGTGLGLSLSYDIVTKGHGGSLVVESQKGRGTTFVITLPGNV